MKAYLVLCLFLAFAMVMVTQCCSRVPSSNKNQGNSNSEPYYFGTQSLKCLLDREKKIVKRGVFDWPRRKQLEWAHRLIKYRSHVFEHTGFHGTRTSAEGSVSGCDLTWESSPAGYSTVSVDCLRKCEGSYTRKYGIYNLVFNNCHNFANRMSKVLYENHNCPAWCR